MRQQLKLYKRHKKTPADTQNGTVRDFAGRAGMSDRSIRREIEQGNYIIRPKVEGSKSAVLINMIYIAVEAAEQAERVRQLWADRPSPQSLALIHIHRGRRIPSLAFSCTAQ